MVNICMSSETSKAGNNTRLAQSHMMPVNYYLGKKFVGESEKILPSCVAWQTPRTSTKAAAHERKKYLIIFPMLSVCNKLPAQAHENHHVCWFSTNKLTQTAIGWMIEVSHIEMMTLGAPELHSFFSSFFSSSCVGGQSHIKYSKLLKRDVFIIMQICATAL